MTKLCQIIAIANGRKSHAASELTQIYHMLQKPELMAGISRVYRPKEEEGEQLPPEKKNAQFSVGAAIIRAKGALAELFDTLAAQDFANCEARADVVVDGKPLLHGIPVTHLLFLEKQLIDLGTLVGKLPTLDPAETWSYDPAIAMHRSEKTETTRTKKVPRNHVKAEATKEHPAQVEMYYEDTLAGYWSTTKFSGAIAVDERNEMLDRVRRLQDAVKIAREEANGIEAKNRSTSGPILGYIFGE
jgi:hypothetical protein